MSLWDWKAPFYGQARRVYPFRLITKAEMNNLRTLLAEVNLNGCRVLDLGTGTGLSLSLFSNKTRMIAVDQSLRMLQIARQQFDRIFVAADVSRLPFRSLSYDLIVAVGVLEYIQDTTCLLTELQRLLHPKGYGLLTYSQNSAFNWLRHLWGQRIYSTTPERFQAAVEALGFTVQRSLGSLLQHQVLIQKVEENE